MFEKYIKPKSLTWWSSFVPLAIGVFVAFAPIHGQTELVAVANSLTGGASPGLLVAAGLGGIGLRGAV